MAYSLSIITCSEIHWRMLGDLKSLNKQLSKRSPRKLDARCPHLFCSSLNFWPLLARAGRVCYKTKKLPIALVGSAQNVSGDPCNHSYNNLSFVWVSDVNCLG